MIRRSMTRDLETMNGTERPHVRLWAKSIPATVLARASIWLYGGYSLYQGLAIIVGGPARWAGPSYAVVKQVPGSPYVWGAALIAFGALTLFGSVTRSNAARNIGLAGLTFWSAAFSFGAFAAQATVPTAGTTGGPVYLVVGCQLAILTAVNERAKAKKRP